MADERGRRTTGPMVGPGPARRRDRRCRDVAHHRAAGPRAPRRADRCGAVRCLRLLGARPGAGASGPTTRRAEARVGAAGAARVGLLRPGGAGRRRPGGAAAVRSRGVRARRRRLPHRAGLPGRRPADHGLRRPGARARRARQDAGAGHGPRPRRARRTCRPWRRSATPAGPGRLPACRRSSSGAVGFTVQRAHATTPRMRMELRTTVSWREEVEAGWSGAGVGLRAARPPSPRATGASRQVRGGTGPAQAVRLSR